MLELKYLYECTYVAGVPTNVKAYNKYTRNPIYFKRDYYRNVAFELLYGYQHTVERSKIFEVVPVRGEI